MNGSDREGFIKAMKLEIDTLNSMNTWEVVDRPPSMDPKSGDCINILDSLWTFKVKCYPSREINTRRSTN